MRYHHSCAYASLVLGAVSVAHAQSAPMSLSSSARSTDAELTRAQVLQDLQQWHAAGMSFVPHPVGHSDSAYSPEYQRYLQRHKIELQQAKQTSPQELSAKVQQPQR